MRVVYIEFNIDSEMDLEFFCEIIERIKARKEEKEELSDEEIKELEEMSKDNKKKVGILKKKEYVCPICGKRFKNGSALGGHVRWCKSKQKKNDKVNDDFDFRKMFLEEKRVMDGVIR